MTTKTLLLLIGLAGCDAQVDANHQGTPLARLWGTVDNGRTQPTGNADVAAVWEQTSGSPDRWDVDAVGITGGFPADFELAVYAPPKKELLNDWGAQVGVAYILASPAGTDYNSGVGILDTMLGMELDHLLVYLPEDVPAGTDASYILRGTPSRGFHIYGVHRLSPEQRAARRACIDALSDSSYEARYTQCGGDYNHDDFVPLGSDLDTPLHIDLVDDPSTIAIPQWT